jgi:hypothetical protein
VHLGRTQVDEVPPLATLSALVRTSIADAWLTLAEAGWGGKATVGGTVGDTEIL